MTTAVPEDSASAPFLSSLFPVPCLYQWPTADAEGREKMQADTGVTPQIPSRLQLFAAQQLHSPLGSSPAELMLDTAISIPLLQNSVTCEF